MRSHPRISRPRISNGSAPLVTQLLAHGANPNLPRENGETPLMTAARLGRPDLMKLLLRKGAKVNARTDDGWTALMCAVAEAMPMQ